MGQLTRALVRADEAALALPEQVQEMVRFAGDSPDLLHKQPGKFRTKTKVFALIASLSLVSACMGIAVPLAVLSAIFFGFGSLFAIGQDLTVPSPRGRTSASAALGCYAKSLKLGHWKKAYACLQPSTLPQTINLPKIFPLNVMPDSVAYSTPSGFSKYWKSIFKGKGGTVRICKKVWFSQPIVQGNIAHAKIIFKVERFSAWLYLGILWLLPALIIYFLSRKTVPLEVDVTLFRYKSQWWLLPEAPTESR